MGVDEVQTHLQFYEGVYEHTENKLKTFNKSFYAKVMNQSTVSTGVFTAA